MLRKQENEYELIGGMGSGTGFGSELTEPHRLTCGFDRQQSSIRSTRLVAEKNWGMTIPILFRELKSSKQGMHIVYIIHISHAFENI